MKKNIAYAAVAALLGLVLAGCSPYVSPCTELAPPTAKQIEVAAETDHPTEVEKTVRGTECDLVNGTWSEEDEESA